MNEQEFIYGSLKQHTEQIDQLTDLLEKQQDMIEDLLNLIAKMQSPEYARRQVKVAEMADIAEKMAFIRNLNKK
jgi:predicted site-specific integrase-resolvase